MEMIWQLNPCLYSAAFYGIIKANVMGRPLMCTTLTILHHGILFCAMWCPAQLAVNEDLIKQTVW